MSFPQIESLVQRLSDEYSGMSRFLICHIQLSKTNLPNCFLDLKTRNQVVIEARDFIENSPSPQDLNKLVSSVTPPLLNILEQVPPSFTSTSPEHVCLVLFLRVYICIMIL